jgi:hypothetical protein
MAANTCRNYSALRIRWYIRPLQVSQPGNHFPTRLVSWRINPGETMLTATLQQLFLSLGQPPYAKSGALNASSSLKAHVCWQLNVPVLPLYYCNGRRVS